MKKNNLLLKTLLITISIVTLIMTVIYCYLYFFSVNHEVVSYDDEFNRVFTDVTNKIEQYGIPEDGALLNIPDRYFVVIYNDKNEVIFPKFSAFVHYTSEQGEEIQENNTILIERVGYDDAYFEKEKQTTLTYQGKTYQVNVVYFGKFNWVTFYNLFRQTFPVFCFAAITISVIFTIAYNYYFTARVKKITAIMQQMRNSKQRIQYPKRATKNEFEYLEQQLFEMYDALEDSFEQLENEMQLRGQIKSKRIFFMSSATHELKTPLMVISSTIELLLEGKIPQEQQEQQLILCYTQTQKLAQLVAEILDFSQIEKKEEQISIHPQEIVDAIFKEYQYFVETKQLDISLALVDTIEVPFSSNIFQKLITNLIDNAIKFTYPHGAINLSITSEGLTIINDMNEHEQHGDIMEAFVTYDKEKGHGLGLYFIASICEQYGITSHYEYDLAKQKFIFKLIWKIPAK